jgi:hypothetical protein
MRPSFTPFLRVRVPVGRGPSLGRSFSVLQETWSLRDDPRAVAPDRVVLATRKTASEAADLARAAAAEFTENGFHKPSGAWWGSEGLFFHRFLVTARRPRAATLLAASLLGGAAIALLRARSRTSKRG